MVVIATFGVKKIQYQLNVDNTLQAITKGREPPIDSTSADCYVILSCMQDDLRGDSNTFTIARVLRTM